MTAQTLTSRVLCHAAVKSDETSKLQVSSAAQARVVEPVVLNLVKTYDPAPIVQVELLFNPSKCSCKQVNRGFSCRQTAVF